MSCIKDLKYDILLGNCSYQECADYIISNSKEILHVLPGYRIFDLHLIGISPIPIGIDGENVIFPYLRPCHGCFVLKIEGKNELRVLRTTKKKVIRFNSTDYEVIIWDGNICEKCPRKRAFLKGYSLIQCLKKPNLSFKLTRVVVKSLETIRNYKSIYLGGRNV